MFRIPRGSGGAAAHCRAAPRAVGSAAPGRGTWAFRSAWETLGGHVGQGCHLSAPLAHFLLPAFAAASPFPCSAEHQPSTWSHLRSFLPLGTISATFLSSSPHLSPFPSGLTEAGRGLAVRPVTVLKLDRLSRDGGGESIFADIWRNVMVNANQESCCPQLRQHITITGLPKAREGLGKVLSLWKAGSLLPRQHSAPEMGALRRHTQEHTTLVKRSGTGEYTNIHELTQFVSLQGPESCSWTRPCRSMGSKVFTLSF